MRLSTSRLLFLLAIGAAAAFALGCGSQIVPVAPRVALPAGCSRLSDGSHALLSPDGRLLAFARWNTMGGAEVPAEMTEYYYDLGAEPLIPGLVVRDLVGKREWDVPGWKSAGADGVVRGGHRLPVSWAPGGAIVLADGAIIDPRSGAAVTDVLRPPADVVAARLEAGQGAESWSWTPNGRRIAYVSKGDIIAKGGTPERAIYVADAGGAARRVDLSRLLDGRPVAEAAYPDWLGGAALAWSPDGETLFFRLAYIRVQRGVGPDDVERTGLYVAREKRVVLLSESTGADGAPDETVGEDVWDAVGRRSVFIATTAARPPIWGKAWEGTMDVVVAEDAGKTVRRVTTDGVEKGRPCIDPAGHRVALFVGERAGRAWGAAGKGVRLRVIDLEGGPDWESPLAPPPDSGAPLGTLRWMPEGRRLFYTYDGIYGSAFTQEVP